MDLIKEYFKLIKDVYEYFNFEEDWVVYPLNDCTDYHWKIDNNSSVIYGGKSSIELDDGNYYADEIYKQRFYDKWIYRADGYTMIFVDTHTDGNKFFSIFDNSKELK